MLQTIEKEGLISKEEYNLLIGAKPLTPQLTPIDYCDREAIFAVIKKENIEYRYINGSCEDRAHYISLLLSIQGINVGKIWNFAPARYTFISNELFEISDPYGVSGNVTWGYHVAPYLLSYSKTGDLETLVIDQSFSPDSFLTLDTWLQRMNCPRAIQLYTDIDSYLFNSIFGYVEYDVPSYETSYNTPLDIPSIITGNFWSLFPGDDFVQKGLAINDLAINTSTFKKYLTKEERDYLGNVLISIDEVIKLVATNKPEELHQSTFDYLVQFYWDRYNHWGNRVNQLTRLA